MRSLGAQMVLLVSSNHFLAVFFVLPTMPTTHTQRLVTVYQVVLTELAILILFYNTTQENPFAQLWAQIIDSAIVVFIKVTSVGLCHWALLRRKELVRENEVAKVQAWRARKQWHRVLTQQAPPQRGSNARRKEFAQWKNENALLLTDHRGRQFFDAPLSATPPAEYRDPLGRLHYKIVLRKRNAIGLAWPARRTTTLWTQESTLGESAVRGYSSTQVAEEHATTFAGLHAAEGGSLATAVAINRSANVSTSRRRSLGKCHASVLQTASKTPGRHKGVSQREGLYAFGADAPNACGGISGWSHGKAGTVRRADVYLASPALIAAAMTKRQKTMGKSGDPQGRANPVTSARRIRAPAAREGGSSCESPCMERGLAAQAVNDLHEAGKDKLRAETEAKAKAAEAEMVVAATRTIKQQGQPLRRMTQKTTKLVKARLQLQVNEEHLKSKVFSTHIIHRLANVPESCLLRQADGSVGFFAWIDKGQEKGMGTQTSSRGFDQEEEALVAKIADTARSYQTQLTALEMLAEAERGADAEGAVHIQPADHGGRCLLPNDSCRRSSMGPSEAKAQAKGKLADGKEHASVDIDATQAPDAPSPPPSPPLASLQRPKRPPGTMPPPPRRFEGLLDGAGLPNERTGAASGEIARLQEEHEARMRQLEAAVDELAARRAAHDMTAARDRATVPVWRVVGADMFRTLGADDEAFDAGAAQMAWPTWVPVVRLMRTRYHSPLARFMQPGELIDKAESIEGARMSQRQQQQQRRRIIQLLLGLRHDAPRKGRPSCGLPARKPVLYTALCKLERSGCSLTVDDLCVEPMAIHRRLAVQYQRRRLAGWTHDQTMAELNEACGLPVVWKGASPFTGDFDPWRLRVSWFINTTLLLAVSALLCWDYLSITAEGKEMDWAGVLFTFFLGVFAMPLLGLLNALVVKALIYAVLQYQERRQRRNGHQRSEKNFDEAHARLKPYAGDDRLAAAAEDVMRIDRYAHEHLRKVNETAVARAEAWRAALLEAVTMETPAMASAAAESAAAAARGEGHGAEESAASSAVCYHLGTRVYHELRGPGTVTQILEDGRTRIHFDNGEVHRYRPSSVHKLHLLRRGEVEREHRATLLAVRASTPCSKPAARHRRTPHLLPPCHAPRQIKRQNDTALNFIEREKQTHQLQLRRFAAMGEEQRKTALSAYLAKREVAEEDLETLRSKLLDLVDNVDNGLQPRRNTQGKHADPPVPRALAGLATKDHTADHNATRDESGLRADDEAMRGQQLPSSGLTPYAERMRIAKANAARSVVEGQHVAHLALLAARSQLGGEKATVAAEEKAARAKVELEDCERAMFTAQPPPRHQSVVGGLMRTNTAAHGASADDALGSLMAAKMSESVGDGCCTAAADAAASRTVARRGEESTQHPVPAPVPSSDGSRHAEQEQPSSGSSTTRTLRLKGMSQDVPDGELAARGRAAVRRAASGRIAPKTPGVVVTATAATDRARRDLIHAQLEQFVTVQQTRRTSASVGGQSRPPQERHVYQADQPRGLEVVVQTTRVSHSPCPSHSDGAARARERTLGRAQAASGARGAAAAVDARHAVAAWLGTLEERERPPPVPPRDT